MLMQAAVPTHHLRGYADELALAESQIAELESRRQSHPGDLEKRLRLAYRAFHRASLTGSMTHFGAVDTVIREILEEFGPKEDLCLLKANLDFRFHRIEEARQDLEMCPLLAGRFEGRTLLADIDFQRGRYREARQELEHLIAENRTWDTLARLAYWESKLGEASEADRLYDEAEDELTAKQMQSYAWLELQRGVLALTHGRYEDAWRHYLRADRAFPGHWHTLEHMAELLAAEEKFDDAIAMFECTIARAPKPELQQALGELYIFSGRHEEAQPWLDRALASYLRSVEEGGVHYFHHLADFYSDARDDSAEAVKWAHLDITLRSNFSTQAAMAWALYRHGELPKASEFIRLALLSGVQDANIHSIAATIFGASGDASESKSHFQSALRINPRHPAFHMHR